MHNKREFLTGVGLTVAAAAASPVFAKGMKTGAAAQAAEEHGFDSFYVPEHTHIPASRDTAHPAPGDASLPDDRYMRTLDPWVALATACAVTERIRLGTCVALPLEHDPILAAVISNPNNSLSGRTRPISAGPAIRQSKVDRS